MNKGDMNEFSSRNNDDIATAASNLPIDGSEGPTGYQVKPTKVIAGAVRGVFDADIQAIENFYHLICQRVRDQATCDEESTEVVVYLSDGTSRRLPSIDEFKKSATTGSAVPTVVNLSVSLSVGFPGNENRELQNVDIAVRASDITADTIEHQMSEERIRFASDKMQIAVVASESDLGIISYTIDHTRISWGLDIENLIQAHISKVVQRPSAADKLFKWIKNPLHLVSTILVGLVAANQFIGLLFYFLFETEGAPEGTSVVDVASTWLVNGHIAKYIVVSLIVSVVIVILTSTLINALLKDLRKPRPSFILLSEHDKLRRSERLKKHSKRWTKIAATVALNFVALAATVLMEDRIMEYWRGINLSP